MDEGCDVLVMDVMDRCLEGGGFICVESGWSV